jgi:hypothetical protein
MSLDALLSHLHRAWRHDSATQSTIDALVYELSTHGLAALKRQNCRRRLADASTRQMRDVIRRLIGLRPNFPAVTDELLLKLGEQL